MITKLKIEEIVNPYDITLLNSLECPIDNMITLNPSICNICETVFCTECIDIWKKSSQDCPICRSKPLVNIQREKHFLGTQIAKILIKCPNNRFGCQDIIKVYNYKINHEYCRYNMVKCDKCLSVFVQGDKLKHLIGECEYFKLNCIYCQCKYSLQTINDHMAKCFKQIEENLCKFCMKKHDHDNDCDERVESCLNCSLPDLTSNFTKKIHICLFEPFQIVEHLRRLNLNINKLNSDYLIDCKKKYINFQNFFQIKSSKFYKICYEVVAKLENFNNELSKEEQITNKKNIYEKNFSMNNIIKQISDIQANIKGN